MRFTNPIRLAQVDSTNRYLRDAALAGAAEGTAVLAEEQLAGRGRRDRSWHAPKGSSLLCSVLFRPDLGPGGLHLLATAVGLAALDAVLSVTGLEAWLKWPNDVLLDGAKLAGILAEVVGTPPAVVVGIGLNVAWPPGWPPRGALEDVVASATTLERASGHVVDREELATVLLEAVGRRYAALGSAAGRARTVAEYRRHCATIGRDVRVVLEASAVEGRAVDIGDDGRLVVALNDGSRRAFDAGDVVHLR